jgi:hypothetical protein
LNSLTHSLLDVDNVASRADGRRAWAREDARVEGDGEEDAGDKGHEHRHPPPLQRALTETKVIEFGVWNGGVVHPEDSSCRDGVGEQNGEA